MKRVVLLASVALAASACVSDASSLSATAIPPTATLEATIASTTTPTLAPTLTLEPTATQTPKPSSTPIPEVVFSGSAAGLSYVVPLTVQWINSFEVLVHFELEQPGTGWLLYRPNATDFEGWWAIPLAEESASHQIPLVGLTPGTSYFVQVGLGASLESLSVPRLFGTNWGPIQFETPSLGTPDLRFGVVGDTGFGDEKTRQLVELMDGYDLDFVLHTGDVVYNVNEQSGPREAFALKYFTMFAPLIQDAPMFPVPGNHEYDRAARFNGRPYFVHAFPSLTDPSVPDNALGTWYAFDFSGIQFLMLDTQAFLGAGGRAEQTAWLAERLADPSYRYSIPVLHTPPYTSGRHRNDGAAVRSDWNPLFEAAGVPVVFSGHDHNYERIWRDGVTYIVSGGGSAILYPETDRVEGSHSFQSRTHFVLVEIFEDRISLTAIGIDGAVLDRTTIPVTRG